MDMAGTSPWYSDLAASVVTTVLSCHVILSEKRSDRSTNLPGAGRSTCCLSPPQVLCAKHVRQLKFSYVSRRPTID